MLYAQERRGQKLHLVHEPGEETASGYVMRRGNVSQPLCGRTVERYRMTINLPMGMACRNCRRVLKARRNRRG